MLSRRRFMLFGAATAAAGWSSPQLKAARPADRNQPGAQAFAWLHIQPLSMRDVSICLSLDEGEIPHRPVYPLTWRLGTSAQPSVTLRNGRADWAFVAGQWQSQVCISRLNPLQQYLAQVTPFPGMALPAMRFALA